MLTADHLKRVLESAFNCDEGDAPSRQALHRGRSAAWICCLAAELRRLHTDPGIRVFFKADTQNRQEFGLNELLFDVCVCQTGECKSSNHGKVLRYVTRALWLVESEFARDSFEAVKDFNKLVIGSAENKLFVGPRVPDMPSYLRSILPVALACQGNVYVAIVPHPGDWANVPLHVQLFQIVDKRWQEC